MRKDGARPIEDRVRVLHMLESARDGASYIKDRSRDDLETDSMLRRALKDCFLVIGEAAAKVSDENRARVPGLPWNKIVGMRHKLVHVYYDIDNNALWEIAVRDLPALVALLEQAIAEWPNQSSD